MDLRSFNNENQSDNGSIGSSQRLTGPNMLTTNPSSYQQYISRNRLIQTLIDVVVIFIVFIAFIMVMKLLEPRIQGFYCSNTDIFFPIIKDQVPLHVLLSYGTIGPVTFIILVELFNSKTLHSNTLMRKKMFIISVMHAMSLFVLGLSITLLLTEIGKRWVGRLRPHFIAVCDPDWTKVQCFIDGSNSIPRFIDTSGSFCRGSPADVEEARLSFPSGHSSFACYTMGFLIIYLEARLVLYTLRFIKPLLQMTALIAAYITAISRISDYHHRGTDVLGGALLGSIVAFAISFGAGRVLWKFGVKKNYYDIDLRPEAYENSQD